MPTAAAARGRDACDRGLEIWRRAVAAGRPLLAAALAALLAAASLSAQTPPSGLFLRGGPEGGELPAPVLATDVSIRVTGMIARARVSQTFTNPEPGWMEGVYRFPLPSDAALDTLRLVVGERVIEGQIREKQEARRVYEEAKRSGAKASLVGQGRPNLFTTRVANIRPGERVEVVLEYQQTVSWEAGSFRLRFPTTFTPRYRPGGGGPPRLPAPPAGARAVLGGFNPVAAVLAEPEEPDGCGPWEVAPDQPLRLAVDLDPGFPLSRLQSPTHPIEIGLAEATARTAGGPEERGGRLRITLGGCEDGHGEGCSGGAFAAAGVVPDRDFELAWEPVLGSEPQAALFVEEAGGDVYALLTVLPPDAEAPGFSRLPRETIFVLDVSGSMSGASIRQAKAALLAALSRLTPEDSFNVLAFSSTTRALFPGSWPAEPETVEHARRWVEGLEASGGTEMLPALLTALDGRPEGYGRAGARTVQQVIFITDGAVSNEEQLFSAIEAHLGEARLFPIGIGSAPNGHFLLGAAALGRGSATFIADAHQVRERMEELFAKLESPALTGVEVIWDDPDPDVWPRRLPDLYAGEPLVVAARLRFLGEEIRVSGERDGSFWEQRLEVDGLLTEGGSGVAKLWARRAIGGWMEQHRRAPRGAGGEETPERSEIRRRVVDLALTHHLVSPFTTLVAVDVTPSRPEGEPLAQRRVPNAVPAGWTPPGQLPAGGTAAPWALAAGLALLAASLLAARWGRRRARCAC